MARNFASASSQYFQNLSAPVTAVPLTLACWFNTASTSGTYYLVCLDNSSTSTDLFALYLSGQKVLATAKSSAGASTGTTSTTYSANVWHHACGVFASASSQTAYLDGGNSGSGTFSRTPSGLGETMIGRLGGSAPGSYYNGLMAEVGIWNVALSAQEVAALAQGRLPRHVRPQSLVAYWPLWGLINPEPDLSGNAYSLTNIHGATAANHAPVTPFTRKARTAFAPAAAAGAVLIPRLIVPPPWPSPALFE